MEISSKKLERSSKILYFAISLVLCLFLILLTNKLISDIDNITESPNVYDYENQPAVSDNQHRLDVSNESIELLENKKTRIEQTIEAAKSNCSIEKESFDNWIKTRKTIGSPANDTEVLARANKLDEFYKIEQEWRGQLSAVEDSISQIQKSQEAIQSKISDEQEKTDEQYRDAMKDYDLKVFLIRLALVAPVLLIGIWFFMRFSKNKYWPLFQGFTLYSLYAFFFGLVPYLPSYGGYIRYTVGIVLCVFGGYYAINRIRKYLELKKIELETSSQVRSKNVQSDTAEKALMNHVCPSCGKDFILRNWECSAETARNTPVVTDFCRFCGLELFSKCGKCGNMNFVHLPFCAHCGDKTKAE